MNVDGILIASSNPHKVAEIRKVLQDLNIEVYSAREAGVELRVVEDGATFEANAAKKALAFGRRAGRFALADDSGLEVEALGGRPGVFSARYAGPECDYAANNRKLLAELEGVEVRRARFVCVAAFADADEVFFTVRGEVEGTITESPRGQSGFGYDPVFFYDPAGKTFAEMTPEEKNAVSHRGRAVRAFREKLAAFLDRADG